METVAVIGGTGFIGDYLVKDLNRRKNIKLLVIYKKTPPNKKFKNAQFFRIDGAKNSKLLFQIIKGADYLIILARPDIELINNIIKSGLSFKKIVYTSTILIYPNSSKKQNENSNLEPANDYEKRKIDEEKLLSDFANDSGSKLTIARLTNVYGDTKNRALIHWILTALVRDTELVINNNGKPVRDFIFVEDVAAYLTSLIFLDQKQLVEIFNVCTGTGYSINEIISKIQSISGIKLKLQKGSQTDEKLSVIGDNAKITQAVGFKPKFSLEAGLKKAYQNYLKN